MHGSTNVVRTLLAILCLALVAGCYRPSPTVLAAQHFERTAYDLVAKDEELEKRLNSLRLGMTDREVISAAGAPTRRETRDLDDGRSRETWVYVGEITELGTLVFEGGRLVQLSTY